MNDPQGTVLIIDDDPSMRKALHRLCQSVGFVVKSYSSAHEFLTNWSPESPACLLLDIRMPGLNGLDLQAELAKRDIRTPIIFITGHGDVPMTVRAMKAGAVDFLTKPFHNSDVLAAVRNALAKDVSANASQNEQHLIRKRLQRLTPRERQVFDLVLTGMLNKQIAAELGASEQTIKVHRGRVMEKMEVQSVAELVQAALKLGVIPPKRSAE